MDKTKEIEGKNILITGGGGSIGSELCRQVIKYNFKKLIILDIYENNLYEIETELKQRDEEKEIETIIGSIRDKKRLEYIFEKYKPEIIFHTAAHKHVPLMEKNPIECIKNNIIGTSNLLELTEKYRIEKFVLISTDKAVNPTSIMGASKRFCEKMVQAKANKSTTKYTIVRFGNVLESNGSVIPLFKKQIKNNIPVTVTSKEITRFFMTIPEAVELILQAIFLGKNGEIFILDMGKPVKIYEIAQKLIKESGKDIPIKITGLRPGEKIYEELLTNEESLIATKHDKIFISPAQKVNEDDINRKMEKLRQCIQNENLTNEEVKKIIFNSIKGEK